VIKKDEMWKKWGVFRLQVIGQLLASPPTEHGQLKETIEALAAKQWTHPMTLEPVKFGVSTIERWYYRAQGKQVDTVAVLARKPRKDMGGSCLGEQLLKELRRQHHEHSSWSAKLHFDNLQAFARQKALDDQFSYQSARRQLRRDGLVRTKRRRGFLRDGEKTALESREAREVRSYEATHIGGLWHLDFHHAKRQILTTQGDWVSPILFAVIDDRSRLICHLQWYLTETTRDLSHGFSQALMRRGLPRKLMTDNGSAMMAGEFVEGLSRLGIEHEPTLPYSPHQNGKMECFWGQVEGRLMAMIENKKEISLHELNRLTHAWVEMDYHRQVHSETSQTPINRFLDGPSVLRKSPDSKDLRSVFRIEEGRTQRRSDGTITIEGVRFEIPNRFRTLLKVFVRYARWDLSDVSLIASDKSQILCDLYPINKEKNSNGARRTTTESLANLESPDEEKSDALPPYLAELVKKFEDTVGQPPFISQ